MTHEKKEIRYISTFSGIAGFEVGIERAVQDLTAHSRMARDGQEDIGLPGGREEKHPAGDGHPQAERSRRGTGHRPRPGSRGGRNAKERERDARGEPGPDEPDVQGSAHCLGFSEIDRFATAIYRKHFPGHANLGDITKLNADSLPDFDLLVGGFPCQAFSIAGKRGGFQDTRGTLFFDLARILKAKRPRLLLFENVKGLLSHDQGRTFWTIIAALDELGYGVQWQVLNSKNFGVPQNRERVLIVGHLRGTPRPEVFPLRADGFIPERVGGEAGQEVANALRAKQGGPDIENTYIAHTLKARADSGIDKKHPQTLIHEIPRDQSERKRVYSEEGLSPAIQAGAGEHDRVPKIVQRGRGTNKGGLKDIAPAISTSKYDHNNFILARNQRGEVREMDVAGTIPAHPSAKQGQWVTGINHPSRGIEARPDGLASTLKGNESGSQRPKAVVGEGIRRLTPVECERLQGFEDGWTAEGWFEAGETVFTGRYKEVKKAKEDSDDLPLADGVILRPIMTKAKVAGIYPVSDTQRYKTLGNAVTTNVIREVARRMLKTTFQ